MNSGDNDATARDSYVKPSETQKPPSSTNIHFVEPREEEAVNRSHNDGISPPGGNSYDGSEDKNDYGNNHDPDETRTVHDTTEKETLLSRTRGFIDTELTLLTTQLQKVSSSIGEAMASVLHTVPPQVTVALIGIVTAFFGARAREKSERRKKEEARLEEQNRERAESVTSIRANYRSLEACMLKTSYLLANRLKEIVEGSATSPNTDKVGTHSSMMYSTYLLASYLASVELLKKHTNALNLGLPAADRIFTNIVGRIQGVFAADDEALATIQTSERFFKPKQGESPIPGGELRVLPGAQVNIGKLLLRSYWGENDLKTEVPSMNSILTYVEFCDLYETKPIMKRWCSPLRDSFQALEKARRRRKSTGARAYVAQSALLDLVDFLDPGPRCRYISSDARQRLKLGDASFDEEVQPPSSVQAIYRALGALRDGVGALAVTQMRSEMKAAPLEVYVKAPEGEQPPCMHTDELGDCPYSQTVLLLLEELRIPYRAIRIRNDDKPGWYHLINPQVRTPVVYHEGYLVSNSLTIEQYIRERFSNCRLPCSAHEERQLVGLRRFTRFHGAFLRWLCGDEESYRELNSEIRILNGILRDVANRNEEGGCFFGGTRLSREDIAISPFLYHTVVAGKELKNWLIPNECEAIKRYIEEMNKVESFVKTKANTRAIIEGYGRVMKEGKDRELKLAVALE